MTAGTFCETNAASSSPTFTAWLVLCAPKKPTAPSWIMRHWEGCVPAPAGAVTLKAKIAVPPGGTGSPLGRFTLLRPQVLLLAGDCEPSLKPAAAVQVMPLVFCIVTLTG